MLVLHPKTKKCVAVALLLALMLPTMVLPAREAHALFGIADFDYTVRIFQNPTDPDFYLNYLLRPLARAAVKVLLITVTQQIVDWIQGDSGKNVGFVQNLEEEMRRQLDIRAGEFLNKITGINLCGNIGAFLRISLRYPGGLRQQLECSLSDIIQNVESHFQNFQNGGWPAFMRIALIPQNNPYGAFLIALDGKLVVEGSKSSYVEAAAIKGSGFLGFGELVPKNCEVLNDGDFGPMECQYEFKEQTPGQFIAHKLNKATDVGIDFALNAKDFDEAIGTIITALIQKIISSSSGSGGGIFGSSDTSQSISLSPSQNNAPFLARVNDSIKNSDALLISVDLERQKLYQELFKLTGSPIKNLLLSSQISDINSQLAHIEQKKTEIVAVKDQLLGIKQTLLTTTDPQTVTNSTTQLNQLNTRLVQLSVELGIPINIFLIVGLSSGSAKEDALITIDSTLSAIQSSLSVADLAVDELTLIVDSSSESSTRRTGADINRANILIAASNLQKTQSDLGLLRANLTNAVLTADIDRLVKQSITLERDADVRIQFLDNAVKSAVQFLISG